MNMSDGRRILWQSNELTDLFNGFEIEGMIMMPIFTLTK